MNPSYSVSEEMLKSLLQAFPASPAAASFYGSLEGSECEDVFQGGTWLEMSDYPGDNLAQCGFHMPKTTLRYFSPFLLLRLFKGPVNDREGARGVLAMRAADLQGQLSREQLKAFTDCLADFLRQEAHHYRKNFSWFLELNCALIQAWFSEEISDLSTASRDLSGISEDQ